jgi:hypothetical protein
VHSEKLKIGHLWAFHEALEGFDLLLEPFRSVEPLAPNLLVLLVIILVDFGVPVVVVAVLIPLDVFQFQVESQCFFRGM